MTNVGRLQTATVELEAQARSINAASLLSWVMFASSVVAVLRDVVDKLNEVADPVIPDELVHVIDTIDDMLDVIRPLSEQQTRG